MSSLALGAAFAAVQLVHQAYSKVKSSKARCARLVERCQLVVDRLERIAETKGGDAIIKERIHELERAFGHTALTIAQVGQQGIITSLLRSEANALRIESCNEALTELISLFNLEELVDVRRWQSDLEVARVRDHGELVRLGRRVENGNAAIHHELAQQGATIAEVLRVIHDINAGFHNAHSESTRGDSFKIAIPLMFSNTESPLPTRSPPGTASCCWWRAGPAATGTITPLPIATTTDSATGIGTSALCTCKGPTATKSSKSPTLRRLSFTFGKSKKRAKVVPPSTTMPKLTASPPPFPSPSRGSAAAAARDARDSPRTSASGRSAVIRSHILSGSAAADGDDGSRASSSLCHGSPPTDPPPPYQLRVINPAPEYECPDSDGLGLTTKPTSSSRFTTASIEAVRAPDSPVPAFPSPKLSTESVFGSTQSLASVASTEDGTVVPGLRCDRRNSAAAAGSRPVLRRKDTIRFARRATLPSGYPRVQPIV